MAKIVKTRVEFEGRWHEGEVIVEEEELEVWQPDMDLSIVGRETPRVDGPARVSGRAVGHLPGVDMQLDPYSSCTGGSDG